jgi:thiol-disulfide isomerase/thioredoxin
LALARARRPCKAIAPVYEQLAAKHPTLTFLKVDTDANSAVARRFNISAMPTFVFLREYVRLAQTAAFERLRRTCCAVVMRCRCSGRVTRLTVRRRCMLRSSGKEVERVRTIDLARRK